MKNIGLYDKDLSVPRKKDVDAKQNKITVEGILKGDGAGGITAALANVEYATCTKLLNGRARGSLRTSGASAEDSTYAMGIDAFAQGNITKASGNYSHAEGSGTMATALMSHAEGVATIASGYASHTEGVGTTANHDSQHAQGQFNIADNSTADSIERGNYAHIVGNGTSDTARSNAHTLDWSGNAWFAGDVYVGSTSGKNKDDGSKKLITADEVESYAESTAQNYSIYYAYCSSGTIKGGDIDLENPDVLIELINQSISQWVTLNDYVGVSRPVIIATFESEPSGEFNNKVLLSLNTVDTVTTTTTFSGIYRNSANKMFLCEISFNFTNRNIGVSYTEISKSDTFIAMIGTTSYNDVLTAFNAGKIIYAKDSGGNIYQLTADEDPGSVFSFINFYTIGGHGNNTYEAKGCILTSNGWNEDVTYSDLNAPQPSDLLPLASGTAAVGTSYKYAREDHVHPAEVFIATYGTTTLAEIMTAYNAGKVVFCVKPNEAHMAELVYASSVIADFSFADTASSTTVWTVSLSDEGEAWTSKRTSLVPTTRTINNKFLSSNIQLGHTYNTTLTSSGWTSSSGTLTQTLTISGLVATYNAAPSIDLALDQVAAANKKSVADAWGKISGYMEANTAANSITFTVYADTAPTVNIPIRITTYD